jgi:peptidoglycan/LPS O-acetylase OafA/YrhL
VFPQFKIIEQVGVVSYYLLKTSMNEIGPNSLRRNNLDFIRLILACAVIFSHSFKLINGLTGFEPLESATHAQLSFGALAVDWFFVISGFLITNSWLNSKGALSYFRKRALRIYPAYVVVSLIGGLVIAPHVSASAAAGRYARGEMIKLIRSVTTLHYIDHFDAFPENKMHALNGSLWTIGIEAWCYVGVAVIGAFGLLVRRRAIAAALVVAIAISVVVLLGSWEPSSRFSRRAFYAFKEVFAYPDALARLIPYFLAGMFFYLYRDRIPLSRWFLAFAVSLLVAAAMIPTIGVAIFLPVAGTYVLFWLAFHPLTGLADWAKRVGGDYSYGVYLYAFPIQQFVLMKLGPNASPFSLFIFSLPISLLAGVVSWHLCEKWFLRRKHSTKVIARVPDTPTITTMSALSNRESGVNISFLLASEEAATEEPI